MLRPKNVLVSAALFVAMTSGARADAPFQIASPAFADGDVLPSTFGFDGVGIDKTQCGGGNQSPPLAWTNVPAGTRSFALVVFDVDGFNGLGVAHWVAYNFGPAATAVAQGEAASANPAFTNGIQQYGQTGFRGFCPPKGQSAHHYVMTVYALDVPPALPAGMTRAQLLAAIDRHILRASSIVGRYSR